MGRWDGGTRIEKLPHHLFLFLSQKFSSNFIGIRLKILSEELVRTNTDVVEMIIN